MCKQILPTSTIRNIWRTERRTCMLILGLQNASRTPRGRDQVIVSRGQQTILRLEQFFRDRTSRVILTPLSNYQDILSLVTTFFILIT